MNLFLTLFSRKNQEKVFWPFAYSYLRDKSGKREDVVMESMIALWEKSRPLGRKIVTCMPLLLTIIKNKALHVLEHKQVRLRAEETISSHNLRELDLRISTLKACEPDKIFNTEIQHIVNKTLQEMPEQSRRIFMLSRYQNLANKQIADSLNISLKTVEAHITKVLRILRLRLKDYLITILIILIS